MSMLVIKYLVSAAIIVLVSELAKQSDRGGALLASLPVVTLMVLVYLLVRAPNPANVRLIHSNA